MVQFVLTAQFVPEHIPRTGGSHQCLLVRDAARIRSGYARLASFVKMDGAPGLKLLLDEIVSWRALLAKMVSSVLVTMA